MARIGEQGEGGAVMGKLTAPVLLAHIHDLCERYNIGWSTFPSGRGYCGLAIPDTKEIETPEIKGWRSYPTTLHEIGHIVGPYQHPWWHTMMHERGAWTWARRNALIWSPGMEKLAQESLAWYAAPSKWGVSNAQVEDWRRESYRSTILHVIKRLKAEQIALDRAA
jgi:hypothetical protein